MIKIIGIAVVVFTAIGGALYIGGYIDADVGISVTNKGAQVLQGGLDNIKDHADDGIDLLNKE